MSRTEPVYTVLENTAPLAYPRGERLPLYIWALMGLNVEDEAEVERLIRELDTRGIALIANWDHRKSEDSLGESLRIGRAQQRLGLPITVNANALLHRFCDGDPRTAHVTEDGTPFFDTSFDPRVKIGCPFSLRFRYPEIRERVELFARAYRENGLSVDLSFADWEIDGPIEWNGGWEAAKK